MYAVVDGYGQEQAGSECGHVLTACVTQRYIGCHNTAPKYRRTHSTHTHYLSVLSVSSTPAYMNFGINIIA